MGDRQVGRRIAGDAFYSTFGMSPEVCSTASHGRVTDICSISNTAGDMEIDNDKQISSLPMHDIEQQTHHPTTRSYHVLPFTNSILHTAQLGSSGMLICDWDQFKTTYTLSIHFRLPEIVGARALKVNFSIRQSAAYWTSISLRSGTITLSNLVGCDSDIWKACIKGDESAARTLINSRKASPYDSFGGCTCDNPWRCWGSICVTDGDTVLVVGI